MKTQVPLLTILALFFFLENQAVAQATRLLRFPAISANHIAFSYGGDLLVADRDGKNLRRLTTFTGQESNAQFSPDGKTVAFSGEYDGNTDVYTLPLEGGEPKRLTWHPLPDIVKGWTPDGKQVVFASGRENAPYSYPNHFYKMASDGKGLETSLPIPRVWKGSYSPDGKRFAYQMVLPWEEEFRNYRGGQNGPIRVIDLASFEEEKLPFDGANDNDPQWVGDEIFFLSD